MECIETHVSTVIYDNVYTERMIHLPPFLRSFSMKHFFPPSYLNGPVFIFVGIVDSHFFFGIFAFVSLFFFVNVSDQMCRTLFWMLFCCVRLDIFPIISVYLIDIYEWRCTSKHWARQQQRNKRRKKKNQNESIFPLFVWTSDGIPFFFFVRRFFFFFFFSLLCHWVQDLRRSYVNSIFILFVYTWNSWEVNREIEP